MTISRDDFLRRLPGAVGGEVAGNDGSDCYTGIGEQGRWTVRLAPLPELTIGRIRLPRLQVHLELDGFDQPARKSFLARWELNFRRGGG